MFTLSFCFYFHKGGNHAIRFWITQYVDLSNFLTISTDC